MRATRPTTARPGAPPVYLNQALKALSGVSVAADQANHVVVGYATANHTAPAALNTILTVMAAVGPSGLQQTNTRWLAETTRIQPALTHDAVSDRFVMAWREQNFATTLATATLPTAGGNWSPKVMLLSSQSHVAPALGSAAEYSESVLWYAFEGA